MFAPLVFGAVVYVFASGEGIFTKLLSTRFFRWLGEVSFSIYMIHLFGVEVLMKVANVLEKVTGWTIKAPHIAGGDQTEILIFGGLWVMDVLTLVYLAVVIVVSGFTYRLIEKPDNGSSTTAFWCFVKKRRKVPCRWLIELARFNEGFSRRFGFLLVSDEPLPVTRYMMGAVWSGSGLMSGN